MSGTAAHRLDRPAGEGTLSRRARLKVAWDLEFANFRWRLLICVLAARLIPDNRATGLRTFLVRAAGLSVAARTRFLGIPKLTTSPGPLAPRLKIGADCTIGTRVILEFSEVVTIGDRVTLGDGVVILTTSHQLGPKEHRAGTLVRSPVVIGNDVVIGADAIILPGTTLGDGSRVSPNSVVNVSVAAGVTVCGIPARPLRATAKPDEN